MEIDSRHLEIVHGSSMSAPRQTTWHYAHAAAHDAKRHQGRMMTMSRYRATEHFVARAAVQMLATALALVAVSGCGAVGANTTRPTASASPSPTPSLSVATPGGGHTTGVCTATPVPGCQMVADPFEVPSTCHITMGVLLSPRSNEDKLPSYGYGADPVYLSGQNSWYVAGQGAVFLIVPAYTGAVHITGHLIGNAKAESVFGGPNSRGSTIDIPSGTAQPYWRFWDGEMSFTQAGCYALTLKSTGAADVVTIYVHAGDPLPG